jgi:predicted site-specific integrase-resolvase
MIKHSTREAAKKLGINYDTLAHYIAVGKVPAPEIVTVGRRVVHMWTEAEIEHVRKLLPKIANGRKTRYKKQSALSSQHSAKAKPKKQKPKKKFKP